MISKQIIGLALALFVMGVGCLGSILPALPSTPLVLIAAIGHKLYFPAASLGAVALTMLVLITALALVLAHLWFPWKGMFVLIPEPENIFAVLSAAEGWKLYAASHLFLAINASTMMTLAFMFGCFNMKPAAATILSISFLLLNLVLESIPALADYRPYLLLHHFRSWMMVYAQPVDWPRIFTALSVLAGFNVTCLVIGGTAFHLRDIKS